MHAARQQHLPGTYDALMSLPFVISITYLHHKRWSPIMAVAMVLMLVGNMVIEPLAKAPGATAADRSDPSA